MNNQYRKHLDWCMQRGYFSRALEWNKKFQAENPDFSSLLRRHEEELRVYAQLNTEESK